MDLALGTYLRRKEDALRVQFKLDDIPESHRKRRRKAEMAFLEAYRDNVLKKTRILDPACGSGAFLIAAFDYLLREYARTNEALTDLESGQLSLFDLNKTILHENLYRVDISKESVEITKLSLWLKTAEKEKVLTFLDGNIQQGNSVIEDTNVDPLAFKWDERCQAVMEDGGFDVIIGNPPYIRHERFARYKPYLETYQSYDGSADLYAYFVERSIGLLKPGGILSFIISNKWLKSRYGLPLRRFLAERTIVEQIVDFGHAPIFEDADVFPCIVAIRKPEEVVPGSQAEDNHDASVVVCPIPPRSARQYQLTAICWPMRRKEVLVEVFQQRMVS